MRESDLKRMFHKHGQDVGETSVIVCQIITKTGAQLSGSMIRSESDEGEGEYEMHAVIPMPSGQPRPTIGYLDIADLSLVLIVPDEKKEGSRIISPH